MYMYKDIYKDIHKDIYIYVFVIKFKDKTCYCFCLLNCILRNFCVHSKILVDRFVKSFTLSSRILQYKGEIIGSPKFYINTVGQMFFNPITIRRENLSK